LLIDNCRLSTIVDWRLVTRLTFSAAVLALFLAGTARPVLDAQATSPAAGPYRTLDDRFTVRQYASLQEWQPRAAYLREHIFASAGLLPMPIKTPLRPQVFDERKHDGYSVFKVYFESLPGFFVTGNLYKPAGSGRFPAILSPHGHWAYGRLENTPVASVPARAVNLARQGFVVFTYDMIGYNDSRQLVHREFGGKRESLWGLSVAGLQLWNSIRSVDFLQSLPEVDGDRIGATGASGGGTQTFLLAAVDERIKVAAPVNMISLHMQGGCLCENLPGLRIDTNNVELAATIAPRPLLMVSATGDWTKETMQLEYPEMQKFYALFDARDHVLAVQEQADHNYNRQSREHVYAWMARWLKEAPADVRVQEKSFQADVPPDVLVFYGRPLPADAITPAQLMENWIAAAKQQMGDSERPLLRAGLLHALGIQAREPLVPQLGAERTVVLAANDPALQRELTRLRFQVKPVSFTPFDAAAASKINHFETYNRTAAAMRVADIVRILTDVPGAILVADGDAALPGLLAGAIVPVSRSILDVGGFDTSDDSAFIDRLYIPGLRRAGDLQTAMTMNGGRVVIHNAGTRFTLPRAEVEPRKLTAKEIILRLRPAATQ
jgi:dienelactone hydrolase